MSGFREFSARWDGGRMTNNENLYDITEHTHEPGRYVGSEPLTHTHAGGTTPHEHRWRSLCHRPECASCEVHGMHRPTKTGDDA